VLHGKAITNYVAVINHDISMTLMTDRPFIETVMRYDYAAYYAAVPIGGGSITQ